MTLTIPEVQENSTRKQCPLCDNDDIKLEYTMRYLGILSVPGGGV